MKPYFNYSYKAQEDNKTVDIHIYGIIGINEEYWGDGTNNKAYALVKLIKKLDKDFDRINVHINSPGGYISDGLAIYNTLKACNADIHTYNSGLIASMAGIIMLAGITHYPLTSIHHMHRASTFVWGNVNDLEKEIKNLKVFEAVLIAAIQLKTGMSKEDIQTKWFDGNDHYLTAEQAYEFGFVDVLEEEIKADPPAKKEDLENMAYQDILSFYEEIKDSEDHAAGNTERTEQKLRAFLKKATALFVEEVPQNKVTNKKQKNNMKTLKSGVTALLAFFSLTEFSLNEENKVEITIDEAINLNDDMVAKQAKIDEQESTITDLNTQITDLNKEITDLKALNGGKPVKDEKTKKDDITIDDKPDAYKEISDDVSEKLHNYNREEGVY